MSSRSECTTSSDLCDIVAITPAAYSRMLAICQAASPAEACGILTLSQGGDNGSSGLIDGVMPIQNASSDPELTFRFHPSDWIDAYYQTRKNRQSVVGFFHSHPNAAPIPSPSDEAGWLEMSGHGPFTYWIISLWDAEQPACSAYRRRKLDNGSSMFAQVSVQIT